MKKMFKRFMLAMMVLVLVACNKPAEAETDKAEAKEATVEVTGYNKEKPIKMKVSVEGDKITAVEILEQEETENLGGQALEKLSKEVVEKQSISLDGMSGATETSKAFMEGLNKALDEIGFDKTKLSK